MTPGELTRIEDTLRRAYADALAAVQRDDTSPDVPFGMPPGRPPRGVGRSGGTRRWLMPAVAAAAVAVVALAAGLIVPNALPQRLAPCPGTHGYQVTTLRWHPGEVRDLLGAVIPVNLATDTALPPIKLGASAGTMAVRSASAQTAVPPTFQAPTVPWKAMA